MKSTAANDVISAMLFGCIFYFTNQLLHSCFENQGSTLLFGIWTNCDNKKNFLDRLFSLNFSMGTACNFCNAEQRQIQDLCLTIKRFQEKQNVSRQIKDHLSDILSILDDEKEKISENSYIQLCATIKKCFDKVN